MQFGLFDHVDVRNETPAKTFNDRIELIREAEQAGFRAYHVAEHHGTPLGLAPSPGLWLAAVARETRTIRLGAMVYCLPLYTPLRLLEEICMLDHLCGGRLDVGVGRGASPFETEFFGVDAGESVPRYVEALTIIRQGLEADVLDFEGEYYNYRNVPLVLRPFQATIPLWSAPVTPESMAHAARDGMNIMALGATERVAGIAETYRNAWEDSGAERGEVYAEPFIGACRLVCVAETDERAEAIARPAFQSWFDKLALLWRQHDATTPILTIENFDKAREIGMVVAGSPDRVADALSAQIEQCGLNYTVLQFTFGDMEHAAEMRSLALFAERVMPGFCAAAG